jgi:hypothetical protein
MTEESKSPNRTLIIVLAVGALVLALGAGVIAAVVILGGDDTAEGAEVAQSAALMPEDTFMFAAFNPHLDQAENYEVIERAWGDSPLIQMGLGEILSSMEKDGFSYKDDIEPWLGDEISFGMMGDLAGMMFLGVESSFSGIPGQLPQMDEIPEIPQFVITVATSDADASKAFMRDLRDKSGEEGVQWEDTVYQGVDIAHSDPGSQGEPAMAYAVVDNALVIAVGGLEPMQAVVDAWAGTSQNLTNNQDFQDVLAKLPAGQIGYGYVDVGAYMDALMEAAGSELAGVAPELINPEQYAAFKGAGFSGGFESNGLRVDFVTLYDKDALPEDMLGTQEISDQTAGRVPAGALIYLAGAGLGDQVQMLLDTVQSMPDQPEDLEEQLQMMTAFLGVTFEELIEMLSGEFALAVAADPGGLGGDSSMPVGVGFLLEAKDEGKFERLINSISSLVSLSGEMELGKETIGGVEVATIPGQTSEDVLAGVGVGEGYFVIATNRELLETAFGGGDDNLADAEAYKTAVAPLPETRSGLFFMNMSQFLALAEGAMDPMERESFAEAKPVLGPIKAISAGAEPFDANKDSMSGVLFFLIESE